MSAAPQSVGTILGTEQLPATADPLRTAVIWREGSYTYAELRERALGIAAGLREWARESLASYKLPKRILVLESLPRNQTGKVLKEELRRRVEEEEVKVG